MSKKYCEYLVQRLANNRKDQKIKELQIQNRKLQSHLDNYHAIMECDRKSPTREELHLRELVDKGADYITINHYMRGYDLTIKREDGVIYRINRTGKDEKYDATNN